MMGIRLLMLAMLVLLGVFFWGAYSMDNRSGDADGVSNEGRKAAEGVYHWAVLVAGSRYFWNYRHQADVCHAYQVLRSQGMPDDRIITMVYDDIADNKWQPAEFKGKVFNRPGGQDVYAGCAKDYTGQNVTAEVLYAVLSGNRNYVDGVGSGRVIESGPNDNIFVFYSDHGGSGIIGMPAGSYVFATNLTEVLIAMHDNQRFKELVFYLESCESGSMFENLLPRDIGVYALSASNSTESSWATYCPSYDDNAIDPMGPTPSSVGACLGDLFSVSWMEDSQASDAENETLLNQFVKVYNRTAASAENDYAGSEVLQFGELAIDEETTSHFISPVPIVHGKTEKSGGDGFVSRFPHLSPQDPLVKYSHRLPWGKTRVNQRDADLVFFMHQAAKSNNLEESDAMLSELRKMVLEREKADKSIRQIVDTLVAHHNLRHHSALLTAALDMHVKDHEGRFAAGKPLVDDWSCLRGMLEKWEQQCGKLNDYSMKYSRTLATLCNIGVKVVDFSSVVDVACSNDALQVTELFQKTIKSSVYVS